MSVLIFANGDLQEVAWIRPYLAAASAVIAANGGSRHLWRLGHLPDLVVGDMDSLPLELRQWLLDAAVPLLRSPVEKDETDLELALVHAVEHFDQQVVVFAASGGRLDQTLANVLLLAHPALIDKNIELRTEHERAWVVTADTQIEGREGDILSLIPLSGDVWVRSTVGLTWPLSAEKLAFGPARGISNSLSASTAAVSIASGVLLCVHTSQTWNR